MHLCTPLTCPLLANRAIVRQHAQKHGPGVLTFTLGVRPSGVDEVGCILHGIYRGGATVGFHGYACVAPPPPPPLHFVPCADAAFEIISEWDSGWQARVTLDDWHAGREVRVAFGPRAGPLQVFEVYAAEEEVVSGHQTLGSLATFTIDEVGQHGKAAVLVAP